MSEPLLDIRGLKTHFATDDGWVRAVDGVDISIAAGETWNFQTWHRDSVGGIATSNFTNGLAVTFQ